LGIGQASIKNIVSNTVCPELVEGPLFLLAQDPMVFWTYLLHCRGGLFYTGHTDDLERRIGEHKSGQVHGFTQDLLPIELVWTQEFVTRDEAKAAEKQIKSWSRRKKLALIRGDWAEISRLAKRKNGPSTSSGQAGNGEARITILKSALRDLLMESINAFPAEACGLLLGHGLGIEHVQPALNVHSTPRTHFEIDPQALVDAHRAARQGGPEVLGYYHSHPAGPAGPSATDREQASGDGRIWAIVPMGDVTFWRDDEDGFAKLSYSVADR
jgi:predicted GIY-YIG superfamily endonuclease/proteasome lid subunit RPN8/RPN11